MVNTPPPPSLKGFTLVEVLVALAITGLLVSVLMSALFYMFRVQEALRGEVVVREMDLRGKAWFREALAGCMPMEEKTPLAFTGSNREIICESTGAIIPSHLPMPVRITFTLVDAEGGGVTLQYKETRGNDKAGLILNNWLVRDAKFKYVDTEGAELNSWPVPKTNYEALPRMIKLVVKTGQNDEIVWLASLGADPWMPETPNLPPGFTLDMFK